MRCRRTCWSGCAGRRRAPAPPPARGCTDASALDGRGAAPPRGAARHGSPPRGPERSGAGLQARGTPGGFVPHWPLRGDRCSSARPPGAPRPAVRPRRRRDRAVHDAAARAPTLPGHSSSAGRAAGADRRRSPVNRRPIDHLGATWQLLLAGLPARLPRRPGPDRSSRRVHYGVELRQRLLGRRPQMVFGDGGRRLLQPLHRQRRRHRPRAAPTASPQYTAGLTYVGPVRRPERVGLRRVRVASVKQMDLGQAGRRDARLAHRRPDLSPARSAGVALRSMKAPGTATTTRCSARTPQPADMDGYVDLPPRRPARQRRACTPTRGIPNRAFYLAATALGGNAWEAAGPGLVRRPHRAPACQGRRLRGLRGGRPSTAAAARFGGRQQRRPQAVPAGVGRRSRCCA